ncbi:MAG: DNA polymerase/3'-5' exonuclease PolX [Pseudomonadota bacterium]
MAQTIPKQAPLRAETGLSNGHIASVLDEIADLLEIEQANPFRIRAYRNAARTVRGCAFAVSECLMTTGRLPKLPAIGDDLAGKIATISATGSCPLLERLKQEVPSSLTELMHLPAIGPARARQFFHELGIDSLSALQQAADQHRLQTLRGIGAKLEQQIATSLQEHLASSRRFLRPLALAAVQAIVDDLRQLDGVSQLEIAGSARRQRETVGDIDILVVADDSRSVTRSLAGHADVARVLSEGNQRATVVLHDGLQVDVRVVSAPHVGAALQYLTGSKAHGIALRRLAQSRGYKLNEYGLFDGSKAIAGATEAGIYQALGLDPIPPELREDQGEMAAAATHRLPQLLNRADLRGDLHVHSRASDGQHTIEQMVTAAQQRQLRYIAITDHSQHLHIAHGLTVARLMRQLDAIDALNEQLTEFTVLTGIEVDILPNGKLDLPDSALARLDVVIGAVHSALQLSRTEQTTRVLRAMESRHFTMLAHPSCRLLGERGGCELDLDAVIQQARQRGCFLELNAQPQRMDLSDHYCRLAKEAGVLVAINSDAHRTSDFAWLDSGVGYGRRAWLGKADVLNCRALPELRRLLQATRL